MLVHQDRYYRDLGHLEPDDRARHNFDHPDAIEEALMVEHLELLRSGSRAPLPVYDFCLLYTSDAADDSIRV